MLCILLATVSLNICCAMKINYTEPTMYEVFDYFWELFWAKRPRPANLTVTERLIEQAGYVPEMHRVVTTDGYILFLTRIISPKGFGRPVLMVHSVFAASDQWLQRGRNEDLAFLLADEGYDVWIVDLRGNGYSNEHQFPAFNDPIQYYKFSFHEMGYYDIKACVNEILKNTTYGRVAYIGFSTGTTPFFVLNSKHPEFNDYFLIGIMLSPLVYGAQKIKSKVLKELITTVKKKNLEQILTKAKVNNILLNDTKTITLITRRICKSKRARASFSFLGDFFGEDRNRFIKGNVAKYFNSSISGGCVKCLVHHAQVFDTTEFKDFDYGIKNNYYVYFRKRPPVYKVNQVATPIVLFYGTKDHFVDEWAIKKLQGRVKDYIIYKEAVKDYTHLDFLFAEDVTKRIYNRIIDILGNNNI